MISPPGVINHSLPNKNKYTNFKNIKTILYNTLTEIELNRIVNFIKLNYLQNKDNIFSPKLINISPYFNGHNSSSFISLYTEQNDMLDLNKKTIIEDTKIIGIITARPIHIFINNGDTNANFDAYYIDYLCVDKSYRKKGIAPQIIQTHHYNQSHLNKNINVSLFKREDELTGIIPLTVYSTYGFSVNKWTKPLELHAMYKIVEINSQNLHLLFDFINNTNKLFDMVINTNISNIDELIKTKNIFIYAIIFENNIICAYFFRKSCVFIEKNMEVLSCFASINNYQDNNIFIQGFKISFWKISDENYFGFSAIENVSHNNIIIDNIKIKTSPLIVSPTAYFFYNFAYNTFNSNKVLIIN
jgi:GNAT superfamily N-acetyltransferase